MKKRLQLQSRCTNCATAPTTVSSNSRVQAPHGASGPGVWIETTACVARHTTRNSSVVPTHTPSRYSDSLPIFGTEGCVTLGAFIAAAPNRDKTTPSKIGHLNHAHIRSMRSSIGISGHTHDPRACLYLNTCCVTKIRYSHLSHSGEGHTAQVV